MVISHHHTPTEMSCMGARVEREREREPVCTCTWACIMLMYKRVFMRHCDVWTEVCVCVCTCVCVHVCVHVHVCLHVHYAYV